MKVLKKILKKPYKTLIHSQKKFRNFFVPTAKVLLYHRIAKSENDPHLLCVSPENFRDQIKYLKENYQIVPLINLTQDIRTNRLKNGCIAITFDDGYVDNLHNALPILEEFNVPATIFVTAGYIDLSKPFYWDENTPEPERGRAMTADELKKLAGSNLIEIGAHTMSHPRLAELTEEQQHAEISESKNKLEEILNNPLRGFAYPFGGRGRFNQTSIEQVKKAGLHYACSTIQERVTNKSDLYALPRFVTRNWTLNEFKEQIKNWH